MGPEVFVVGAGLRDRWRWGAYRKWQAAYSRAERTWWTGNLDGRVLGPTRAADRRLVRGG